MRLSAAVFLLLLMLPGLACADQFDDGYDAYHSGNFIAAAKLLTPPAEQGNADAQQLLAETYEALGDYIDIPASEARRQNAEAAKWYLKAAEQGQVDSQYNLGWMYEEGWGVKRDYVQAYKWFSLSEKKKHKPPAFQDPTSTRIRALKTKMTPEEVEEAKRLAREWKPTPSHYVPPPAKFDTEYQRGPTPAPAAAEK